MMGTMDIAARKSAIPDAEWIVTVQLTVHGEPHGDPFEMHYADSYLSKVPNNVGHLIAARLQEEAVKRTPRGRGKKQTKVKVHA